MSSKNSVSSQGYSIKEDLKCDWHLLKDSKVVLSSLTPYPILKEALNRKLITLTEALEIAKIHGIPSKYIEGSLSELEAK